MISGSPPTDRNARTGLFTPPTSTFSARSKISRERLRSRFNRGGAVLMFSRSNLSRLQPACDILGVIGKNDFCSGALEARQDFQDNSLFIQPALLRRRLDHGVFSADVICADRNIKRIAHPADDIQVRQRGLHHHHVGTLFEIQLHFLQRLSRIGWVHLIAAPVAKLGSRLSRFPEGSVEARTIFCGIRKNGNVVELVFIQRFTNGPHPPVHHVRRGDDVGAGACVGERLLSKNRHRGIIGHFAVLDNTTMTMVRVFAEADVGNDKKFQLCSANRFNGELDYALGAEGAGAAWVLGFGQSKKNDPGNPERLNLAAFLHNLIDRLLVNAGHGADFLANLGTRTHEQRIDETRRSKARLANKVTQRGAPPQTPRSMGGEAHALFVPAGARFTVPAKCFSNASTTAAAVVSPANTVRPTPAWRNTFAVTGPTAVMASLSCRARNCSPPNSSAKCWTAEGLKNRTASAAPSAICLKFL